MPTDPHFSTPSVQRYQDGEWRSLQETLAQEVALEVNYAGGSKTLWAWPQDLENLAAGHVLLDCLPQPQSLRRACVELTAPEQDGAAGHCTVTLTTLPEDTLRGGLPKTFRAQSLLDHMQAFIKAPGLWDNTGCFHRAALLDLRTDTLLHVAEDIGRHNCVDRLAGYAARNDAASLHPSRFVLLISSRITASLYHKARRAGFACMVSRSAVTSAAHEAALNEGVSLLGFCRPEDKRLTVFADTEHRISA